MSAIFIGAFKSTILSAVLTPCADTQDIAMYKVYWLYAELLKAARPLRCIDCMRAYLR